MELLERTLPLMTLQNLTTEVSQGSGKIVLLSGETGVGKTSLINQFKQKLPPEIEILWGGCDALFTPKPLGPLYDIAYQLQSDLLLQLENEDKRLSIFSSFLNYLSLSGSLKIIVIEDIHWADDATLDFIKFIGRRIRQVPAILILSFRDEEVSQNHSLSSTLGNLPHEEITRIRLYPLSESAVDILMKKAGLKIDGLYEKTNGNPFYVTEVLSNRDKGFPLSIMDAVNARTSGLDMETGDFLKTLSVIPGRIELDLARKISDNAACLVDQGAAKGLLIVNKDSITFQHELTRLAIYHSIPTMTKIQYHNKVLYILLKNKDFQKVLAQIVHHASHAHDEETIIKYAPLAAKRASLLGSHKEAAANYLVSIQHSKDLSVEEKLALYNGRYFECYLIGQTDEAIKACKEVETLLQELNDPVQLGENYRRQSRLMWFLTDHEAAKDYIRKAIDILKKEPPSWSLAMSYSNLSQLFMLEENTALAIEWGEKAILLANELNDVEILAHAMNNIGAAKMMAGDISGREILEKSLQISLDNGFHDHASRAYINLGSISLSKLDLINSDKYFSEGIVYCHTNDLDTHLYCMLSEKSKIALYLGKWDQAFEYADNYVKQKELNTIDKIIPLSVIGLIRARRNDPGVFEPIEEAILLSEGLGELDKMASAVLAKAEAYWLSNKLEQMVGQIEKIRKGAISKKNYWVLGESSFWLWKSGKSAEISSDVVNPYFLQISGNWETAAVEWNKMGCPYEEALALADGNEHSKRRALELLESLGARATINKLKQEMRDMGMKGIPKGPRQSTRNNPDGLTLRQLDVLELLTHDLSNSEIAERLFISPKTVDHHISAILSKLSLNSRVQAASYALSKRIANGQ